MSSVPPHKPENHHLAAVELVRRAQQTQTTAAEYREIRTGFGKIRGRYRDIGYYYQICRPPTLALYLPAHGIGLALCRQLRTGPFQWQDLEGLLNRAKQTEIAVAIRALLMTAKYELLNQTGYWQ